VDLYIRNDFFPSTNLWQFRSATPGLVDEVVAIDGTTIPRIAQGRWYIAVVHAAGSGAVAYTFMATINFGCLTDQPVLDASSSSYGANGFTLRWNASASNRFKVQYADSLSPPDWRTFETTVESANGMFEFLDTDAQDTVDHPHRFYRIVRVE
jgi:hypothetical protein